MSEAVAVPPGLLILTRTALTASSSAAFFSSSFTRASSVTSGLPLRRDGSSSAMIPERSRRRILSLPVPSTTTSRKGRTGRVSSMGMQPGRGRTAPRRSAEPPSCRTCAPTRSWWPDAYSTKMRKTPHFQRDREGRSGAGCETGTRQGKLPYTLTLSGHRRSPREKICVLLREAERERDAEEEEHGQGKYEDRGAGAGDPLGGAVPPEG